MHDVLCLRMSDSGSRFTKQEYPMAVITFANTKGGAGKTTAALLLTTELLHRNYRVCVIDADPQRWFSKWYEGAALMPRLSVETYVSAPTIQKIVHERRSQWDFVIVDLPGIQSPLLASAVGLSDHVLVPIQGSSMDAQGGAQVLDLLRYLDRKAGIRIPHSVVLSRVNPAITTRSISEEAMFSPPDLIMSFMRSVMWRKPSSSRLPMSPVWNQPSRSTSRLSVSSPR